MRVVQVFIVKRQNSDLTNIYEVAMNTEKIIRLGHEIQVELGFHPEDGITSREHYDEVLKIIDILTCDNATNNKNWALLDVLVPAIIRYDDNEVNLP